MAKAFEWLNGPRYAAMQRAMRNIWFGESAPIAEAAQAHGTEAGEIERDITRFVNLAVQALAVVPENMERVATYRDLSLMRTLTADLEARIRAIPEVKALRAQVETIQHEQDAVRRQARDALAGLNAAKALLKARQTQARHVQEQAEVLAVTTAALAAAIGVEESVL